MVVRGLSPQLAIEAAAALELHSRREMARAVKSIRADARERGRKRSHDLSYVAARLREAAEKERERERLHR